MKKEGIRILEKDPKPCLLRVIPATFHQLFEKGPFPSPSLGYYLVTGSQKPLSPDSQQGIQRNSRNHIHKDPLSPQ